MITAPPKPGAYKHLKVPFGVAIRQKLPEPFLDEIQAEILNHCFTDFPIWSAEHIETLGLSPDESHRLIDFHHDIRSRLGTAALSELHLGQNLLVQHRLNEAIEQCREKAEGIDGRNKLQPISPLEQAMQGGYRWHLEWLIQIQQNIGAAILDKNIDSIARITSKDRTR